MCWVDVTWFIFFRICDYRYLSQISFLVSTVNHIFLLFVCVFLLSTIPGFNMLIPKLLTFNFQLNNWVISGFVSLYSFLFLSYFWLCSISFQCSSIEVLKYFCWIFGTVYVIFNIWLHLFYIISSNDLNCTNVIFSVVFFHALGVGFAKWTQIFSPVSFILFFKVYFTEFWIIYRWLFVEFSWLFKIWLAELCK